MLGKLHGLCQESSLHVSHLHVCKVFEQSLHDAAAKLMLRRCHESMHPELIHDELEVVRRHSSNELLQDVICMLTAHGLYHMTMELPHQQYYVIIFCRIFYEVLEVPAGIIVC